MATLLSTGLCAEILGPSSFDEIFQDGTIEVRSGAQPLSADAAPTGTLLARVSLNGDAFVHGNPANGLRFARDGRFAMKRADQRWRVRGLAAGTAAWFRLLPNAADPGTASLTAPRLDGAIGALGATGDFQLYLPSTAIAVDALVDITQFWFAIPPIGA